MKDSTIVMTAGICTIMLLLLGGILGGESGFIIALILGFFVNFVTFMFSAYRGA